MKKEEAGRRAQSWVSAYAANANGLRGAYISGSYLTTPPGAAWPESSDIDIVLVFAQGACPPKLGKLREQGALLEITCMGEEEFTSLEHILSTHYLAFALNAGALLYDPTGRFARLHQEVSAQYAQRPWVDARCEAFYHRIEQSVAGYDPAAMALPQKVNGWAFTTGLTCFPLLLANLENCTVRKRYMAARRVLEAHGMGAFYSRLLSLLAPGPLGRGRLSAHMGELEKTFSLACGTSGPSAGYPFRRDISEEGAAVAIGGSWELLSTPYPEDAVFWMLATFARCHIIFDMDDPALGQERLPALWAFLEDVGIRREDDFAPRLRALADFLPELRAAAGKIAGSVTLHA